VELDCELIRDGLIGQPVNAFSSLAFAVVAAWLGLARPRSTLRSLGSGALLLVGVGSVWFHADGASLVHDIGLLLVVFTSLLALWRARNVHSAIGVCFVVTGFFIWLASRSGGLLCDPQSLLQGHALWHVLAAVGAGLILYSAPTTSR